MRVKAERENTNQRFPLRVAHAVWSNLPALLAMDMVLLVGAVPAAVLFFGGGAPLAPLAGALVLGPLWAATVASTDAMVRDEAVGVRAFARNVQRYARRGVAVSLVPAAAATAILGTLSILGARPEERWLLVPLVVDGSVAILILLAGFSLFSLATTGGLRGWPLWRTSLAVAASAPVVTLGTISLLVLLAFLCAWTGPGVLPFMPAPFAVYLSAATSSMLGQEPSVVGATETGPAAARRRGGGL